MMLSNINTEQHIPYASAIKKAKNAAFLTRTASPVSLLNPPGIVKAAVNVIVAKRVARTGIVLHNSFIFT